MRAFIQMSTEQLIAAIFSYFQCTKTYTPGFMHTCSYSMNTEGFKVMHSILGCMPLIVIQEKNECIAEAQTGHCLGSASKQLPARPLHLMNGD